MTWSDFFGALDFGKFVTTTQAMRRQLPLPRMSAYDPPSSGEGRLDPLGFSVIADRIASTFARPVRARMQRVRFLTAISLGGLFVEELSGVEPAVAGDTAQLAYERIVVESVARARSAADPGIPGITKAQAALLANERLSARGYLKGPRIFGFHGVYRTLVAANGVLDDVGGTLSPGLELLRVVETETGLHGLSDPSRSGSGTDLVAWLKNESRKGLEIGRNSFRKRSPFVEVIASLTAPSAAGPLEKIAQAQILREPLPSPFVADDEAYLETLDLLPAGERNEFGELELVENLLLRGSEALRARMSMLIAYEEFARQVLFLFDSFRYWSSVALEALTPREFTDRDDRFTSIVRDLPARYRDAFVAIDGAVAFGVDPDLSASFGLAFGPFGDVSNVPEFIEVMMLHHQAVQGRKPPSGKRAWFEPIGETWVVRPLYSLSDQPEINSDLIHPYRLSTLANFLADLRE